MNGYAIRSRNKYGMIARPIMIKTPIESQKRDAFFPLFLAVVMFQISPA